MKRALILSILIGLLAACTAPATALPEPTLSATATATNNPTATLRPTVAPTFTEPPTETPTNSPTATLVPTHTPTVPAPTLTPHPTATATIALPSPTATRTRTPATPSAADECAAIAAKGASGIFVLSVEADPPLVWDNVPHEFKVGLCNTLPASSVPQGKYKIILHYPTGKYGVGQSNTSSGELKRGFNVIPVGPWVPGYENHLANCAQRAYAEIEVAYNDTPDSTFHPLPWADGSERSTLPIQCGGTFP